MAIATVINVKGEVFAVNKEGVKPGPGASRERRRGLQIGDINAIFFGNRAHVSGAGAQVVSVRIIRNHDTMRAPDSRNRGRAHAGETAKILLSSLWPPSGGLFFRRES
jgi:mRNA degradation ribonuclease J1/J2